MRGFVIGQVFANLSSLPARCGATVYGLNAVQEEIGGFCARMAAVLLSPSVAIIFDVPHAPDSPGFDRNKHRAVKFGRGPSPSHRTPHPPLLTSRLLAP